MIHRLKGIIVCLCFVLASASLAHAQQVQSVDHAATNAQVQQLLEEMQSLRLQAMKLKQQLRSIYDQIELDHRKILQLGGFPQNSVQTGNSK